MESPFFFPVTKSFFLCFGRPTQHPPPPLSPYVHRRKSNHLVLRIHLLEEGVSMSFFFFGLLEIIRIHKVLVIHRERYGHDTDFAPQYLRSLQSCLRYDAHTKTCAYFDNQVYLLLNSFSVAFSSCSISNINNHGPQLHCLYIKQPHSNPFFFLSEPLNLFAKRSFIFPYHLFFGNRLRQMICQ